MIPLADMEIEPYAKEGKTKPKFKVRTPSQHVAFEASSQAECDAWIDALDDQLDQLEE